SALFLIAQNYLQELLKFAGSAVSGVPVLSLVLSPDRWLLWLGVLFIGCGYYFPCRIIGRLSVSCHGHDYTKRQPMKRSLLLVGITTLLVAWNGEGINRKPAFLGTINHIEYDGVSDDLLTAGLGKSGLAGAPPGFVDPTKPTAAELRRSAIYNNYRALVDMTDAGGYGRFFGPNVDAAGNITTSEGKIAG